ncbi:MAG: hypothetical protein EOP56_14645 [Sphingobacteriales bacterium]|nr:MAG: hypothetical protein EOP56_14645 [Sphingobacteriales bacterium]
MAVLCAPLTGNDLLHTEKTNNVTIMRMLEYDNTASYFSADRFLANLVEAPWRMMFIFGQQDFIIVRTAEDKQEVCRRLDGRFSA